MHETLSPPINSPIYPELDKLAEIGTALNHRTRLMLLLALVDGPKNVTELAATINVHTRLTSHHLNILSQAKLIDRINTGIFTYLKLSKPGIESLHKYTGVLLKGLQ